MKNVWHIGGWGPNFGDRVLQIATTDIIRQKSKDDLSFTYIDTQKTIWDHNLINKMNNEADLIVVGGGGFLFKRSIEDKLSTSGWQLNMTAEQIRGIKKPIIAYGLGYNKFPSDPNNFSNYTIDNIQTFINKCDFFSFRNYGSYFAIKDMGIDVSKASIVPDAAVFAKPDLFEHECFDNKKIKIGINWATDRPDQRFGSAEESDRKMKIFFNAIREIVHELGAHVYLIDHLLKEDRNVVEKEKLHYVVKDILGDNVTILYNELNKELFPPFDYRAGFFTDIYRKMDLTIGMRGHANIIPFGQCVPNIGIGLHNKVKWFMEQVGRKEYLIDLKDDNSIIRNTRSIIYKIYANPLGEKDRIKQTLNYMTNEKDIFIDKVVGLL